MPEIASTLPINLKEAKRHQPAVDTTILIEVNEVRALLALSDEELIELIEAEERCEKEIVRIILRAREKMGRKSSATKGLGKCLGRLSAEEERIIETRRGRKATSGYALRGKGEGAPPGTQGILRQIEAAAAVLFT